MTRKKHSDARFAVGQAVRKLRMAKGISQEELAELAEIHRTSIGDVGRGTRNISLVNMSKVAAALDVPLSQLIAEMERGL